MLDLMIYGIGGMAKETVRLIETINKSEHKYNIVGFAVDDSYYEDNKSVLGLSVYRRKWLVDRREELCCVCCIGYPQDRRKVMGSLKEDGVHFETIIHPTAYVDEESVLEEGCIIGSYCGISPECKLGKGVFLNAPMVIIGHNCILGDYVTCFPKSQISGGCKIGEAALIGSMAYLHENRKVGKEAVIAPGSVVMRNVDEKTHVIGNPAKKIDF